MGIFDKIKYNPKVTAAAAAQAAKKKALAAGKTPAQAEEEAKKAAAAKKAVAAKAPAAPASPKITANPLAALTGAAKGAAATAAAKAKGAATIAAAKATNTAKAAAGQAAATAAAKAKTTGSSALTDALGKAEKAAEKAATETALKAAGASKEEAAAITAATGAAGGMSKVLGYLQAAGRFIMDGFNLRSPAPAWQKAIVWIVTLAIIGGIAYSIYAAVQKKKEQGFKNFREPFQATPKPAAAKPDPKETTLLNVQPMSIKQAGYGGPAEGGTFDPEFAIPEALKLGYRAFVLQIDYLDVKKDGFEEPGQPTLVYRGNNDALISKNSGSIEKVAQSIANVAFRSDTPNYTSPVILYLHILRTPSPIRRTEEYMKFLSRIAKELGPLAPSHLGLTPMGVFHRQKQEGALLNTPFSALEGKTIIMCNADTSMFRKPDVNGKTFAPLEDLDYWTNMRVYLESSNVKLGVTATAADTPKAVVIPLERLLTLDNTQADAFALKGKQRFTIALHVPEKNPTPDELDRALFEFGVNMVPVNIVGKTDETIDGLKAAYEKQSYPLKPPAMRESKA